MSSDEYLWGVTATNLIVAGVFFFCAIVIHYLVAPLFAAIYVVVGRNGKAPWNDKIGRMQSWTGVLLRWGFFWLGYVFLDLPSNWTNVLDHIVPLPFVLALFFWTDNLIETITAVGKLEYDNLRKEGEKHRGGISDEVLMTRVTGWSEMWRVVKYILFVIVLFILVVIEGGNITEFLNQARLLALIIVFAFQPWFKNIVGGMALFYDSKFVLGNEVRFAGVDGTVRDITLRTTLLRRHDNSECVCPNGRLLEQPVVNYSKRKFDVLALRFKLDENTPANDVRGAIRDISQRLQSLSRDLRSHSTWMAAAAMEGAAPALDVAVNGRVGNSSVEDSPAAAVAAATKSFSVGLESNLELVVRTYGLRRPDTTPGQAALALKNLETEVVFAIVEVFEKRNIRRRNTTAASASANAGARSLFAKDETNDDDNDYTTMFLAFNS